MNTEQVCEVLKIAGSPNKKEVEYKSTEEKVDPFKSFVNNLDKNSLQYTLLKNMQASEFEALLYNNMIEEAHRAGRYHTGQQMMFESQMKNHPDLLKSLVHLTKHIRSFWRNTEETLEARNKKQEEEEEETRSNKKAEVNARIVRLFEENGFTTQK